jgi:hypothetical protein
MRIRCGPIGNTCAGCYAFVIRHPASRRADHFNRGDNMGKYFLAWLLGVPAIVLVLIFFFFR